MKIMSIITIIFICIYMIVNTKLPFLFRLSNSFFIIGLIYLCIALFTYAHNVGFFKLIRYSIYRHRKRYLIKSGFEKLNPKDKKLKILKLHEFCQQHYKSKWKSKIFYKFSIPLLLLSFILSLFSN